MNADIPQPDGDLSPEQAALAAELSDTELEEIDRTLLSYARPRWRKVMYIVMATIQDHPELAPQLPGPFFSGRVYRLVEAGKLEAQGFIGYMGFCEVRLIDEKMEKKK